MHWCLCTAQGPAEEPKALERLDGTQGEWIQALRRRNPVFGFPDLLHGVNFVIFLQCSF